MLSKVVKLLQKAIFGLDCKNATKWVVILPEFADLPLSCVMEQRDTHLVGEKHQKDEIEISKLYKRFG